MIIYIFCLYFVHTYRLEAFPSSLSVSYIISTSLLKCEGFFFLFQHQLIILEPEFHTTFQVSF